MTFSRGEKLGDYIYHRIVMDLFSRLPHLDMTAVPPSSFSEYAQDTDIDASSIVAMHEAEIEIPGFAGMNCPVHVVEVHEAAAKLWIVRASVDSPFAVSYGHKVVIRPSREGHSANTQSGITITDRVGFQDQQIHGVKAFERATLAARRKQAIVYATGTGKSFVLIAPAIANGKGLFVVPDEKQAQQLRADIVRLDIDVQPDEIVFGDAVASGAELDAIERHKYVIVKKDRIAVFAAVLSGQLVSIDEVHEVAPGDLAALLAPERGNTVQAVTATWTEPLQALFGDPLTEINLHFVLTKLKAFRPIAANIVHFARSQALSDRVLAMLVDYYGRMAFVTSDNMPGNEDSSGIYLTLEWLKTPAAQWLGLDDAIREIRKSDEIRRFDHMNMAFSKNLALLTALTDAYQGVFDGTYVRLDELAATVSVLRARARIVEELRLANAIVGAGSSRTADAEEPGIRKRFSAVIEQARVTASDLQQEARDVLRQQIAEVITRHIVGLFGDNTPATVIRTHEKRARLRPLLVTFSTDPAALDQRQRSFLMRIQERGPGSIFEKIGAALGPVEGREEILEGVAQGDYTRLIVTKDSIDLRRFPDARYAVLVPPGDERSAAAAAERINSGFHTHIIGDSELATGYSNPDIMSVQRVIEHVIPEGATRAAQIGGRATRDKDGVAFLSEYLGPDVNVDGVLGRSEGRPFLFEDVLASDYGKRVKQYRVNVAMRGVKVAAGRQD